MDNNENNNPNRDKRGKYYEWNETSMKLAIEAVRSKNIGLNAAARSYGVPKATLHRRILDSNLKAKGSVQIKGSEGDLTPEVEAQMVAHIKEMESILFGYTPKDVRMLAFKYAEKFGLKHRFNIEKQSAGKKWYYNFLRRHPDLSLRQPRATSFNRATAFNKETVKEFFDKLIEVTEKHSIKEARNIYNVDETGLTNVQRKPRKILAQKGKHQVGSITSGERGTTTTAVCCANAARQCVAPLIIFKRKNAKVELQDGAPAGSIFAYNPESGYITKDIFFVWFQHFIQHVKPSPENKVLLILDGHVTHTKHLPTIELARRHGVVLLSLPGHTSNKLQPLDVSFFKPLSSYYIDETEKWLRNNPGRVVTQYQISMLFGKAYERAASIGNIVNGFRKSGIYPIDPDVFQDYEFVAIQDEVEPLLPLNITPEQEPDIENRCEQETLDPLDPRSSTPQPGTNEQSSHMPPSTQIITSNESLQTNSPLPLPIRAIAQSCSQSSAEKNANIQPLNVTLSPKPGTSKMIDQVSPAARLIAAELRKSSRKTQKATELTSSPYKSSLEEVQEKKRKKGIKRPKIQAELKTLKKKLPNTQDVNVSQWFCKICNFCEVEDMIQCLLCKEWVHEFCGGAKKGQKKYFCPTCVC